jgi:phospho-N-acetylmuramoyl-pentapeptide-transferase
MKEGENTSKRKDPFGKSTPIFNKLKAGKVGIPIGGGILVVALTAVIYFICVHFFELDMITALQIIAVFLFMGILGLIDDIMKILNIKGKYRNLRFFQKLILQFVLITPVIYYLTKSEIIGIELFSIFGQFEFAMTILISSILIVFMSNAFNIVDGVDGLSSSLMMSTLIPLLFFNWMEGNAFGVLLSSILFGANLAYLYFNIPPARLFMGDTGSLAMGALIPILMYTSDTVYLLPLLGLIYIIDALSSIIQLASKLFLHRKIFTVAPLHHALEQKGWSESKVTLRLLIANIAIALASIAAYFFIK